jgi:aspartate aminotransferase
MTQSWIADRTKSFDSSGIRKVFDLAAKMKNPINLSIGQPDFDVPLPIQDAAIDAIRHRKNAYSLTQGIPTLQEKLQVEVTERLHHADRKVFVASGSSGALVLAMMALINPGDEVIVFDPYFVMYTSLTQLVNGVPVIIDTAPDFKIDLNKVEAAITPRTKMILLNSPANPTGIVPSEGEVRGLAAIAQKHNLVLVSDELYRLFVYDQPFVSAAQFYDKTLVIDGFSKSHAMTGWRVGIVHGPAEIIDTMIKLQQYTFVCSPQPAQWGAVAAMDVNMQPYVDSYKLKRDRLLAGLSDLFEINHPGGAFYIFPKAPWGTGSEFVAKAIENDLLIIPGNIFSQHDTHFRISYAASDATIERGIEVLRRIAKR